MWLEGFLHPSLWVDDGSDEDGLNGVQQDWVSRLGKDLERVAAGDLVIKLHLCQVRFSGGDKLSVAGCKTVPHVE